MEDFYGEIGKEFIEVHHLKPIHLFDDTHEVDPIKDLITLCPNCHAMIHKLEDPSDISTLKQLIQQGIQN
jgi:5-methylcytosine-specific restriction protein A